MRVVFLDFDGVLNTTQDETTPWFEGNLEPQRVALVNEILSSSRAVVVLSTEWRQFYTANKLWEMLAKVGFDGFVLGITPRVRRVGVSIKHHDISAWLTAAGDAVESYAILDDLDDMGPLSDHHVRVTEGLRPCHVAAALHLLRPQPKRTGTFPISVRDPELDRGATPE